MKLSRTVAAAISGFFLVLLAGCAVPLPPAPPPGPPPPSTVAFDAVACLEPPVDNYCAGPAGAVFKLDTTTGKLTQTGDGNGYTYFASAPSMPTTYLTIDAPGFDHFDTQTISTAYLVATNLAGRHNFFTLHRSHVDPATFSEAQVRAIQTSLSGVFLDEIAPQCPVDPVTGIACVGDKGATAHGIVAGVLFTPAYRMYTAAQRQIIRDVFTGKRPDSRGIVHHYTHYTISLFCVPNGREYHGIYPSCADAKIGMNDALHELWDDGLIPVTFAMDDSEPDDLTTPLSVSGVVDPSLVRIVSPYWEHLEIDCAAVKVRALFPSAFLYWHNPVDPHADSGYPDPCYGHSSEAEWGALGGARGWWQHFKDAYHGTGFLVQNSRGSVPDVLDALTDVGARMGGGLNGWPILDVVWFEDTNSVYDVFWGGGDEGANLRRADQVLAAQPYCLSGHCGRLAGYGSGATSAVRAK